jgi:hypothetical protein
MTFSEAYSLTYDKELAIKLMKADASQRKSEALESIANLTNVLAYMIYASKNEVKLCKEKI